MSDGWIPDARSPGDRRYVLILSHHPLSGLPLIKHARITLLKCSSPLDAIMAPPTATRTDELEMMTLHVAQEPTTEHEAEQLNLPRADGGRPAFIFLFGCFMVEAMCWGELSDTSNHHTLTSILSS